jgi:carbon storage regulator CsrA
MQQQIKIGDQITVTILKVKGNTVRLGIQAPSDVRVIRGELPKRAVSDSEAANDAEVATDVVEATLEPAAGSTAELVETTACVEEPVARARRQAPLTSFVATCGALAK